MSFMIIGLLIFNTGTAAYLFGGTYTSKTIPSPVKGKIDHFLAEAKLRNIDTSKIETLKIYYIDVGFATATFNGACNMRDNVMIIPTKNVDEVTIFHELGHCILGYHHHIDERFEKEVMYHYPELLYGGNKLTPQVLDNFFSNSPLVKQGNEESEKTLQTLKKNPSFIWGVLIFLLILFFITHKINRRKS